MSSIGRFAMRQMDALTHRIANIPEHEQLAGRSTGESGKILGCSGHQTVAETYGCTDHLRPGCIGGVDAFAELRINRDAAIACQLKEARSKLGIAGIQGILDFGPGKRRRQCLRDLRCPASTAGSSCASRST